MTADRADSAPAFGDGLSFTHHNVLPDAAPTGFQDQFQQHLLGQYGRGRVEADPVLIAANDSGASSSAIGSVMNYAGYITYTTLLFSAFGKDDPFHLQTNAMRWFQNKVLHHKAIDNPQTWVAMGNALMLEEDLLSKGANFKPVKLGTLKAEAKHESEEQKHQRQTVEHDGKNANEVLAGITSGLKCPADYILAAKFMYDEAVQKADERAAKEAIDHKDENRALGRINVLTGETDRADALGTRNNSVNPVLDLLGESVSYRLDEARFLKRYGSAVPELGWTKQADDLVQKAKDIYDPCQKPERKGDLTCPYGSDQLAQPVRDRLHDRYPNILTDQPQAPKPAVVQQDGPPIPA